MGRCLRLCSFLGAMLSITPLACAQATGAQIPATVPSELHLNTPIERTLTGGHTDTFTVPSELHLNTPIERTLTGGHTDTFTVPCPPATFSMSS